MNLPMFTWSCVVALIMIFMICKVILFVRVKAAKKICLRLETNMMSFMFQATVWKMMIEEKKMYGIGQ